MSDAIDRLVDAMTTPLPSPASSSLEIVARCQTCGWRWSPPGPHVLERDRAKVKRSARQHGRSHRGHVTEYSARVVSTTARGSRMSLIDLEISRDA